MSPYPQEILHTIGELLQAQLVVAVDVEALEHAQ